MIPGRPSRIRMESCDITSEKFSPTNGISAACEVFSSLNMPPKQLKPILFPEMVNDSSLRSSGSMIQCPHGHWSRTFLACDVKANCWSRGTHECTAPLDPLPPLFICKNQVGNINNAEK